MKTASCSIVPYEAERKVDVILEVIMREAHKACLSKAKGGKDKSCTILCAGDVGCGKSTLMFHVYSLIASEILLGRIGFNTKTFAKAIQFAQGNEAPFIAHDEFNMNSRNSMAEGNKDFIDLLFSVRGENWFLWANNPSVQSIDKQILIEGLVNFIIFIHKEQERYLLFTRTGLMNLIKKHGSASFYNLKTYGPEYAVYEGWFKPFSGEVWTEYLKVKKERMKEKVDTFVRKYSQGDLKSLNLASKVLSVSWATVRKAFDWGCAHKSLVEPRDFVTTGTKHPKLTESGMENLRFIIEEQQYL